MTDQIFAAEPANIPAFARNAINLASAGLGARALQASDEFFAPLARMLDDNAAVFYPEKYDDNGKWMDGWETRRRRDKGHDHAVVALAARGQIDGFDIDTSHFTGNYAPACRIEACRSETDPDDVTDWFEILPMQALTGNSHHFVACAETQAWTHLRVHIYPDGGVARLRVFGTPTLDAVAVAGQEIDLAASLNGGRIIAYSDAHFGTYQRLLAPGRGLNMGDGWETRRRRSPGHDWIIIALGSRGVISGAVVDTAFYKGNFPDSCSIQAANLSNFSGDVDDAVVASSMYWDPLLESVKLSADKVHEFTGDQITKIGPVTHIRLNIFPDGGVSRLRLSGTLA
jgi:allantoicase